MAMIYCRQCGQQNDDYSRSCISCGTSLWMSGTTGDLTKASTRPTQTSPYTPPAPMAQPQWSNTAPPPIGHQYMGPAVPVVNVSPMGFRCPYCQSQHTPIVTSQISTGGWVVFAMMILFCFPLFWIGLLMKEYHRVCGSCGMRLG